MPGSPGLDNTGTRPEVLMSVAAVAQSVLGSEAVARRWAADSALAGYTIGALAGHVLAAVGRTEWALDQPLPSPARLVTVADYFGPNRVDDPSELESGLHAAIRADGAARAEAGPAVVAREFTALTGRLRDRLAGEDQGRLLPVLRVDGGVTTLDDYLATRIVELAVHSDDLAVSCDLPPLRLPGPVVDTVVEVCLTLCRARAGDLAVLRALTRRERAGAGVLWAL